MVCEHLRELENELLSSGVKETFRGQPWSDNCREWVYFDVCLDLEKLRERFDLDECVKDHEHYGTHDGQEAGFYCEVHKDGVMGFHRKSLKEYSIYD